MFELKANKSLFTFEMESLKRVSLELIGLTLLEGLSRPDSLSITVRGPEGILSKDLLDQIFSLSWGDPKEAQYFHGKVYGYTITPEDHGFARYELNGSSIVSDMKLEYHARHFVGKPLSEIVRSMIQLSNVSFIDMVFHLSGPDHLRDFSMQDSQSDLNHLQSVMHEFGWYFNIEHTPDGVIFHVYDDSKTSPVVEQPVPFIPLSQGIKSQASIYDLVRVKKLVTSEHIHQAHDLHLPSALIHAHQPAQPFPGTGKKTQKLMPVDNQDELTLLARRRVELDTLSSDHLIAQSDCMHIRPGSMFTLIGHPDSAMNLSYLVIAVTHDVDETATERRYKNTLRIIPAKNAFRPEYHEDARKVATISMASIHADHETPLLTERGEYILKSSYSGEKTHPVRLATPFAGAEFGLHFPLHKDTQVLVAHLNGHADKPLILGALFNDEQKNVINASNATQNRLVTHAGHTLLMDDTEDKQGILLHTPDQKNRLHLDASKSAQKIELVAEEGEMLVNIAKSTQFTTQDHFSLAAGQSISMTAQDDCRFASDETNITCDAAQDIKHTAGQDMNWHAEQDFIMRVDGSMESTIAQSMRTDILQGDYTLSVKSGNFQQDAQVNLQFKSGAGDIVLITAGASVAFKADGDIVFNAKNIVLKGDNIDIHNAGSTQEN